MAITAKHQELENLLITSEKALADYIEYKGIRYPLQEWVTITEYCKRFGIANTQTVTTWIQRGVIPAGNIVTIEEYNNIRLIKAIPYRDKTSK